MVSVTCLQGVIITWGVLSQGDYIWLEPETSGEFDVAVGAQVRSISGGSIHVVDDDKKVSQDGVRESTSSLVLHVVWVLFGRLLNGPSCRKLQRKGILW